MPKTKENLETQIFAAQNIKVNLETVIMVVAQNKGELTCMNVYCPKPTENWETGIIVALKRRTTRKQERLLPQNTHILLLFGTFIKQILTSAPFQCPPFKALKY